MILSKSELHEWKPWFAWRPVFITQDSKKGSVRSLVWLETIERRRFERISSEYRFPKSSEE